MVGDFYVMVGRHDVYGACLKVFVLVDGDDGYRSASDQYLSKVTGTRGVEVLGHYDGAGNGVGRVETSVESASIPPADDPTTISCGTDCSSDIGHLILCWDAQDPKA